MNNNTKGVDIPLFFFIIYSGLPALSVYLSSSINVLVTICMYVYVVLKLKNRFVPVFFRFLPLFAVDILYCLGTTILGEDHFIRDFYGVLRASLWPLLALIIVREDNKKLARNALLLTLVVYSITAITTIIGCSLYPGASRLITDTFQDEAYRSFLKSFNIGDYQFVYTIALATPVLLFFLKYRTGNPILAILFIVLFIYTIYSTEFTTALLFSVFSLALAFVPKSYNVKKLLLISGILLTIIILSFDYLIVLLQDVSEMIQSDVVSQRFVELSEGLSGDTLSEETDFAVRMDVWQKSWNAFTNNPLWGTYGKGGGHSLVLDTIGDFGFIGMFALIMSFRSLYTLFVRPYAKNDIYMFTSFLFLLTFVFSFFNTGVKFFVFSFIIPITAFYYSKQR